MRKSTNKAYYDKYFQLWPYRTLCIGEHDFGEMRQVDSGMARLCKKCRWLKYQEEFDAEVEMEKKASLVAKRAQVKIPHVDLFHF